MIYFDSVRPVLFQLTQPGRVATSFTAKSRLRRCYFNSRSPGGLRRQSSAIFLYVPRFQLTQPVRVAATELVEALAVDIFQLTQPVRVAASGLGHPVAVAAVFQLTQPVRVAAIRDDYPKDDTAIFQLTQPVRVAAPLKVFNDSRVIRISTHAAREGCDGRRMPVSDSVSNFNSRSP